MAGLEEITKQQGTLADILRKEKGEAKFSIEGLKTSRNAAAVDILNLTKDNAAIMQQTANTQLRSIGTIEEEIAYINRLDNEPVFGILEDVKGAFSFLTGSTAGREKATTRLKAANSKLGIAGEKLKINQAVLKSKQAVVAADLSRSVQSTAGEEADVLRARQDIADQAALKTQKLTDLQFELNTKELPELAAEGEHTDQQLREEADRRDKLADASLMRDAAIKLNDVNLLIRSKALSLIAQPAHIVNQKIAEAAASETKQAEIDGFVFGLRELTDKQTRTNEALAVSSSQAVINETAGLNTSDNLNAISRAAGVNLGGTTSNSQAIQVIIDNPNLSATTRGIARELAGFASQYDTLNPADQQRTIAAAKMEQASATLREQIKKEELEQVTDDQQLAVSQLIDKGQMKDFGSSLANITDIFVGLGSTDNEAFDALIQQGLIEMQSGDIELPSALDLVDKSKPEAQLMALATATKGDNLDARKRMVKAMFDVSMNDFLGTALAEINDPAISRIAASTGSLSEFIAAIAKSGGETDQLGAAQSVIATLREKVASYAASAFAAEGQGKNQIAGIHRVFFGNNLPAHFAQAVNKSITQAASSLGTVAPRRIGRPGRVSTLPEPRVFESPRTNRRGRPSRTRQTE